MAKSTHTEAHHCKSPRCRSTSVCSTEPLLSDYKIERLPFSPLCAVCFWNVRRFKLYNDLELLFSNFLIFFYTFFKVFCSFLKLSLKSSFLIAFFVNYLTPQNYVRSSLSLHFSSCVKVHQSNSVRQSFSLRGALSEICDSSVFFQANHLIFPHHSFHSATFSNHQFSSRTTFCTNQTKLDILLFFEIPSVRKYAKSLVILID